MKTNSRQILGLCLLILAIFFLLRHPALEHFGETDFLQYWAGGRLFWSQQNPYDSKLIEAVERTASRNSDIPILLWNPPNILPLVTPVSFLPFVEAKSAWLIFSFFTIAWALLNALNLFSSPEMPGNRLLSLVFAFSFYPIALNFWYGQCSHILLLGLLGFFILGNRDNRGFSTSFAAGLCLSLTLLKPHLLFLVYLDLLARSFRERSANLLAGFLLGGFGLVIISALYNPNIISWYLGAASTPPIYWRTPTLGSLLQGAVGLNRLSIRMIPSVFALVCTIILLLRRTQLIKSPNFLLVLAPISLAFSPYGWVYDQLLVLPSALFVTSRSKKLAALLCLANFALAWPWKPDLGQDVFFWYPLLVGLLSLLTAQKELRTNQ